MVIIKEKEFRLTEMAKLLSPEIPPKIAKRVFGRILDGWWYDRLEKGDIYKVGIQYTLGYSLKPPQELDFYYGFLRPYKYVRQGKSTGSPNDLDYEFRALHVVSTIQGAEGQWYRDNFKDEDFDDVFRYEDTVNMNVSGISMVSKIIRDLKLKPSAKSDINILSILDRLFK